MVQNKNESATRLYDLLEVEKTATAAQIKTSYKKLALVSQNMPERSRPAPKAELLGLSRHPPKSVFRPYSNQSLRVFED